MDNKYLEVITRENDKCAASIFSILLRIKSSNCSTIVIEKSNDDNFYYFMCECRLTYNFLKELKKLKQYENFDFSQIEKIVGILKLNKLSYELSIEFKSPFFVNSNNLKVNEYINTINSNIEIRQKYGRMLYDVLIDTTSPLNCYTFIFICWENWHGPHIISNVKYIGYAKQDPKDPHCIKCERKKNFQINEHEIYNCLCTVKHAMIYNERRNYKAEYPNWQYYSYMIAKNPYMLLDGLNII